MSFGGGGSKSGFGMGMKVPKGAPKTGTGGGPAKIAGPATGKFGGGFQMKSMSAKRPHHIMTGALLGLDLLGPLVQTVLCINIATVLLFDSPPHPPTHTHTHSRLRLTVFAACPQVLGWDGPSLGLLRNLPAVRFKEYSSCCRTYAY